MAVLDVTGWYRGRGTALAGIQAGCQACRIRHIWPVLGQSPRRPWSPAIAAACFPHPGEHQGTPVALPLIGRYGYLRGR